MLNKLLLTPEEWTKRTNIKIFIRKNALPLMFVKISPDKLVYTRRLFCENCKKQTIWEVFLKFNYATCLICGDSYKIRFTGKKTSTGILRNCPVNVNNESSTEN